MSEFPKNSADSSDQLNHAGTTSSSLPAPSSKQSSEVSSIHSVRHNSPVSRNANETATSYETAELSSQIATSSEARKVRVRQNRLNVANNPTVTSLTSPFAIRISDHDDEDSDEESLYTWEATYRGMPSWLSSLIIHLSLILALALFSVNGGGSKIVNLLAMDSESVDIEPYEAFDIVLEPVDLETVSHEMESPSSKISETTDLAPILDEALLSASLESETNNDLFESVASAGIKDSDLPRRASGGAQFFGVDGEGSDFVFIIDCSGSMADYGRWPQAVRELKNSIKKMKSNQKFLILLYNNGFISMNDEPNLVESTKREQKRAFRWLARKSPNNWTFCAEALAKALSLRPDAIFLLSDGEFNDRQDVFMVLDSLNKTQKLKTYGRNQIPVHTIALGSHLGRFTMKRIADENSGKFKLIE